MDNETYFDNTEEISILISYYLNKIIKNEIKKNEIKKIKDKKNKDKNI